MQNPKPLLASIIVPLMIGSIGLSHLAHQPRFEMFRTVDVLQLTGSGVCFGVALSALFALLRTRRSD